MSWLTWAVFPVDAFEPVAPAVACDASALSEAEVEPLEDSTWNRSVMPDGAPIAALLERPKPATSIVLATVVVIDGAEALADPPEALMGLVVSTLKYALIPPATLKDDADDAVKTYGPGSAPAVPATFQYVDSARLCPLLVVLTIRVQPVGGVIVGTFEPSAMIAATMTSLACVPEGRMMLSDAPPLAVAAPWNPMMIAPGQVSATSHSFAAARHTAPALPGACMQMVLVPSQVSVVQGSPSSAHAAPALPAGCWQALLVPLQVSAVQGLPSSVHAVPAGFLTSLGHVELVPVQVSTASHWSTAARHTAPVLPAGCWQVVLVPLHASVVQGLPSSGHAAPALPAGCVQAGEPTLPLHTSVVQGLVSGVQAVPAGLTALVGQVVLVPSQVSATSHSLTAARHTVPALPPWSGGQVMLVPSQVSATSHTLTAARHTVPACPAGCVQAGEPEMPLHTSVVQVLPSSVQAVPAALTASAGHVALEPVQLSARSHSLAAARHTVPLGTKRHEAEQHEPAVPFDTPWSQSSPASTVPLPQFESAL
jgi:hypothetical protein